MSEISPVLGLSQKNSIFQSYGVFQGENTTVIKIAAAGLQKEFVGHEFGFSKRSILYLPSKLCEAKALDSCICLSLDFLVEGVQKIVRLVLRIFVFIASLILNIFCCI